MNLHALLATSAARFADHGAVYDRVDLAQTFTALAPAPAVALADTLRQADASTTLGAPPRRGGSTPAARPAARRIRG